MKKGIIFDMDGTLWDSSENVAKSWDEVVQKEAGGLRKITAKDVQGVMGHTMTEIAQMLFPMLGQKESQELVDRCGDYEILYLQKHGGVLYPKLEETLRILSERYPLYIVSNCQKGYIEAFLAYYKFEKYFRDTECFGNTQLGKADNIRRVIARNGIEKAVYVGDIQGDYEASRKAGASFIHAAYGFGSIDGKTPRIFEISELPKVVEEAFGEDADD